MDLDTVADELYAGPRDAFTALRTQRAKEAKAAGDRDLADAITALRKPTTAAWLVNRFVREQPDEVASLGELGQSLRDASERLDGPALRELSAQRHQLVMALVGQVRGVARAAGQRVGDDLQRELEETFGAALADADAADALRSGRLTEGLQHAGFGTATSAPVKPAKKVKAVPAGRGRTRDELAERRARAEAEAAARREAELAEARADAESAAEQAALAREAVEAAEATRAEAEAAVRDLQASLAAAEEALRVARQESERRAKAADAAERRLRRLER